MKSFLFLGLILVSMTVNAGSVDALTSVLSIGDHHGTNAYGACVITVHPVNFPKVAVSVSASDAISTYSKLIEDDSTYQHCRGRSSGHGCSSYKFFQQTDHVNINSDGSSFFEKTLRVSLSSTNENKLYVVVSELTVINRQSTEEKVECEIDL